MCVSDLIVYSVCDINLLSIGDTICNYGDIIIIQWKCELFGDHYEMMSQAELMIQYTYLLLKYTCGGFHYYWLVVVNTHSSLIVVAAIYVAIK